MDYLYHPFVIAVLIFGFGFVVFFHELGHFLAAKWVGIRVEQFAVGFGHAVACWRRGMGFMWGSSNKRLERLLQAHIDAKRDREHQLKDDAGYTNQELFAAAAELGIGDTEYRINWMPLGGYVKMLGQDDLNPNAQSEDPHSYNKKSIASRMVVVSAGVIMNVILAALLFMALFIMGHKIQPPIVGAVLTNSPAQLAGMQVGDRVQTFDGSEEHSFTGLMYDMILVRNAKSVPMDVQRTLYANGKRRTETVQLEVQPAKPTADSGSFYAIGIEGIAQLKSVPADTDIGKIQLDPKTQLLPGDVITAVNGTPVGLDDYPLLAQAFQRSDGQPVSLTVKDKTGQDRNVMAAVHFQRFFGEDSPFKLFNIAGMQAQPQITHVLDASPMKGKLKDGDVIAGIFINGDPKPYPSNAEFSAAVADAHARKLKVDFLIDRGGKYERIEGAVPDVKLGEGQGRGVGLGLDVDSSRPVVTNVIADSAAEKAKIPRGALVLKINDTPVNTWFDVHRLLRDAGNAASLTYALLGSDGHLRADTQATLKLDLEKDHEALTRIQYAPGALLLAERTELRQTRNPLTAARWGVIETRDMLRQFYVTLRRVIEGRVSPTNFMGPVGIVYNGSRIAFRGWDYLLWFLAMISANLAVVNFLPIPIVDGGLFVFLIFEKVSGRPLSPRMQTVAQLVGLAIILSVFLLVTYQDIRRMFM